MVLLTTVAILKQIIPILVKEKKNTKQQISLAKSKIKNQKIIKENPNKIKSKLKLKLQTRGYTHTRRAKKLDSERCKNGNDNEWHEG